LRYIAREKAFLAAVEEGIRAEEAGDMVDHAAVVAELDAIIADARKQCA
jgi:predicted transcriptional regulator